MDIARLEGIIGRGKARNGYAVLLTNEPLYWNRPNKPDGNDDDFLLHQVREITGTLRWEPGTGP